MIRVIGCQGLRAIGSGDWTVSKYLCCWSLIVGVTYNSEEKNPDDNEERLQVIRVIEFGGPIGQRLMGQVAGATSVPHWMA
jgi:hypothetical protein